MAAPLRPTQVRPQTTHAGPTRPSLPTTHPRPGRTRRDTDPVRVTDQSSRGRITHCPPPPRLPHRQCHRCGHPGTRQSPSYDPHSATERTGGVSSTTGRSATRHRGRTTTGCSSYTSTRGGDGGRRRRAQGSEGVSFPSSTRGSVGSGSLTGPPCLGKSSGRDGGRRRVRTKERSGRRRSGPPRGWSPVRGSPEKDDTSRGEGSSRRHRVLTHRFDTPVGPL